MSYFINKVKEVIQEEITGGITHFILYPFGERGADVKHVLNNYFGIHEDMIIDNLLAKKQEREGNVEIYSLQKLRNTDFSNRKIIITSDRIELYEELRKPLYEIVNPEQCVDLFMLDLGNDMNFVQMKVSLKASLMKLIENNMIYHPIRTNSVFLLPYYNIDLIQGYIFAVDNYYEKDLLYKLFKEYDGGIIGNCVKGNTVIDAGANIGNHTLYFLNEAKAQKVYSFEAVLNTWMLLKKNISLNGLQDRAEAINCALGAEMGKANVSSYCDSNIGATQLTNAENGKIVTRRLDDFEFDGDVRFIKIDVEGWELEVIKGGKETIKKHKPYVFMEIFEGHLEKACELMDELGYQFVKFDEYNYLFYSV